MAEWAAREALPHSDLTARIIKVFFAVYGELGHGFSEIVYCRASLIALRDDGLLAEQGVALPVTFRGYNVGHFHPDVVVERTVIVEIKASTKIEGYAEAQLLNYLKCAGGGVGLLLNYGRRPEFQRKVVGDPRTSLPVLHRASVTHGGDGGPQN